MMLLVTERFRSIARIDHVYYTDAHGHGHSRRRAIALVGRHRGLAEVAGPSVLRPTECVAGGQRLRSVCGEAMPALLRGGHGTPGPDARSLFPVAAARLLRGDRLGTRHRVASDRLAGGPQFSGPARARRAARSFDDFSHAAPDRRRNAPRRVHLGAGTARRGGV